MSERLTVWGIPCPGDPNDERLTLPYRIWFAAYRTNQQVRHRLGLHQRQRHFSIAPRCDWCGHRSPEQEAIADRALLAERADDHATEEAPDARA